MAADDRAGADGPPRPHPPARAAGRPAPGTDDEVHGGLEVAEADGVTAVRFWGSIDVAVREAGSDGLTALRGATPLTVDLRDVDFMDSTGLSVLVRLVRDAAQDARPVRLLGASGPVADLMVTTGVDAWMAGLGVEGV